MYYVILPFLLLDCVHTTVIQTVRYSGFIVDLTVSFTFLTVGFTTVYSVAGNEHGRGFRDEELEKQILELTRNVGIGAQFGGKYFCHDVRVVRLPRHGASCPVGIGVSCSADRQVRCFVTSSFFFLYVVTYISIKHSVRYLSSVKLLISANVNFENVTCTFYVNTLLH